MAFVGHPFSNDSGVKMKCRTLPKNRFFTLFLTFFHGKKKGAGI